jgi:hypothetical protein
VNSIEPTEDDRRIDLNIKIIADSLPGLIGISEACARLGWRSERLFCEGLLLQLALVIEGETPVNSPEHQRAVAITTELSHG